MERRKVFIIMFVFPTPRAAGKRELELPNLADGAHFKDI